MSNHTDRMALTMLNKAKRKKRKAIPDNWKASTRKGLLAKDNRAEQRIEGLLKEAGFEYTREAPMACRTNTYFLDFRVETIWGNVCIEVDGAQHMTPEGQAKDRVRDADIFETGRYVSIIRLSWRKALDMGPEIAELIRWSAMQKGACVLLY